MEKSHIPFMFFFIILYGLLQGSTASDEVAFSYSENGTSLFALSRNTTGCYADLDSYSHWCLGNLSRCDNGITVSVWIKPETSVTPEQDREIILTSGGHLASNANGFFIERKFGNQYGIVVVLESSFWRKDVLLEHGNWVNIELTWSVSHGLDVRVDGFRAGSVVINGIVTREMGSYDGDGLESLSISFLVGLGPDNQPMMSETCTYDVRDIKVMDRVRNYDMGHVDDGCASVTLSDVLNVLDSTDTSGDPITSCRAKCHDKDSLRKYALYNGTSCACVEGISDLDLSPDDCVNKWRVYTVSSVRNGNSSSDISLNIRNESLSPNPYIKPGEDVLFYAEINFNVGSDSAVFRFEFDDGIVITTVSSPVSHAWILAGEHKVTVTVQVGIVRVTDYIFVDVEDVDEGKAPAKIGLIVSHAMGTDNKAFYEVSVIDEDHTNCTLHFGDATSLTLDTVESFGGVVNIDHEYDTLGLFNVKAVCSNAYDTTTTTGKFISRTLTPSYHYISDWGNLTVRAFGDDTFFKELIIKVGETPVDFTNEHDGMITLSADNMEMGADNVVKIIYNNVVLDEHIVSVRKTVNNPVLIGHVTSGAWNLTSSFTISLKPTDHCWLDIDYGNGQPRKQIYITDNDTPVPIRESSSYYDLGTYIVSVDAYNEVSRSRETLSISVEVPILTLNISTDNITSLGDTVILALGVNFGLKGPREVMFVVDWGDGKIDEHRHLNQDTLGFNLLFLDHKYIDWGIYRISVGAINNISSVDQGVLVQVGENLTYLDILTDNERVPVGGAIVFTINCPTGSDVTYNLDLGDGTNFTIMELYGSNDTVTTRTTSIYSDSVTVSHVYTIPGTYEVRAVATNDFGHMSTYLCPKILISASGRDSECNAPEVKFVVSKENEDNDNNDDDTQDDMDIETSLSSPLIVRRADTIKITVDASYQCSVNDSHLTYSWKGYSFEDDGNSNGSLIKKSIFQFCGFNMKDNILAITPRMLPFGLYQLSAAVAPADKDLLTTSKDYFIEVVQSDPVAHIDGDNVRTIMLYATAIFDISASHDPDLVENRRKDLSFHLFFMPEANIKAALEKPLWEIQKSSHLLLNRTMFHTTTSNSLFLYQQGRCFNESSGLLSDISTFNGRVTFAADNFATDVYSFGIILWAERNNLTAMVSQIVEVRSSNMSLDDLGSLLHLAMNADPDTAIRLCGGAASAILTQDASSADEQEKLAESTEAVVSTLGSVAKRIDSPNQASKCASAVATMTSNKDLVTEGSRSSAAGAFVSLSNGSASMQEATVDDMSNFAGEALGGMGNIFPTSVEEKKGPTRRDKNAQDEMTTVTTELLGLMATRIANGTAEDFGYTTPFTTTRNPAHTTTSTTTAAPTTPRTTSTTTTPTTTTTTTPTTTTTTVITTPTTTIIHTTVGTTLAPEIRAQFSSNGDNFTISGITLSTLKVNASRDYSTPTPFTTTPFTTTTPYTTTPYTTVTSTTEAPTTPVTIPIHPRMFLPRMDERTSYEIAEDHLNSLPEKVTYDELLDYIFDDCLLFRKVMKTPDVQWNCPCISAEAVNMMKCDGDFSLQDRVFDIMTHYEHPDDLYEAYLRPLNKARRIRDKKRKETDKLVATSGQKALGTVADSVGSKTDEKDKTERSFETPRLGMKLAKASTNGTNSTEEGGGGQGMAMPVGGFNMPTNALAAAGGGCTNMDTMFLGDTDNPFTYSEEKSSVGKGVLSLGYSCNGEKVAVEGTEDPIVLWMDRDASKYEHSLFVLLTNTKKDVWRNFNYHPLNITDKNSSLQVVLEPRDESAEYYVYFKYGDRPNMTHFDFIGSAPNDDAESEEGYHELNDTQKEQLRYSVQIPLELTSENGTYWIGIKFKSGNIEIEEKMANTSYTLLNLISGCRFWDETNNTWSSEGCVVGNLTTKYKTQCLCNHLTSFGSDSAVAPNTIDFNNVWAKFDLTENAAVFSTVIALIGVYLLLMIWLRFMDKKDLIKWGALPLEDNLPTDNYHYQVTIQTGVRKHAGTESQVRFIVSGEETDTGVRRLGVSEGERKHLPRGTILNYVMSVDSCLGPLTFLRIWHDNSGSGVRKSWFLDQVQVNDLQTGEKSIFLCNQWLAVEQGDGMVDRILPVAGIDDLIAFKQLFSTSARKKLANDHIWFSIFSRPTRSNFTRVQRLSCCMSLLFLTMITNAMWFKGDTDENKKVTAITLGPISFTLEQFFIGFASTLIVFPVNFIMMTFFRRCRQKNNAVGQVNQPEVKDKQKFRWKNVASSSTVWGPRAKKSRMQKLKESVSKIISFHKKNKYEDEMDDIPEERDEDIVMAKPKKKKPWSLPYWCVYIAWVLCFFSIVTSGFFTILYSMQWGKEKANEWLKTFCLSFFQSVIIVQPIKVLLLVAFIACILKKPDLDEEDLDEDINKVLAGRKACENRDEASLSQIMLQRRTDNSEFQPPDPEELAKSRELRMMEIKMEAVLKEIIIYFIFLGIIFFLSYQQRDPQSFTYGDLVRKNMLKGFDNIRTVLDYWKWLQGTLLPALYALQYSNGTNITYWQDAACTYDMESRRVGVARIRQLRIKNDTCTVEPELREIINHCRDEYGWSDDDTKPYLPFWKKPSARMAEKLKDSDSPFVYQNSLKLKNAPYVGNLATYKGGGYVVLTKRNYCRTKVLVQQAKDQDWLDLNTKGIFLEFTVYNPNSNLFASVTALTEFVTTGNAMPRTEVKVFRLMSYVGGFGLVVLIVEVFFGCFTLYFFYRCIKKLRVERAKYFNDFWNLLEFVLLCFAIACIVLYAFKHILTEVAMRALHDRKSDGFVNFNSIALYDEFYCYIMAVVVFMATIQFLKLLQFNKKMGMLGATIKLATKDLKVFSVAFMLYFFAFTACAFLLFGNALNTYQNVITSFESMFAFALGSFDYESMTAAQPFWGPLFFFSYIGVVYIGLMSIFLTIIGDSFTQVKENVALQANDYEIVDFMWKKVKGLFN